MALSGHESKCMCKPHTHTHTHTHTHNLKITTHKKPPKNLSKQSGTINKFIITVRRKEMFYLTTHSAHFIYGHIKDHSGSDRGNPLPPHGLFFPISSKGSCLYASSYRQDNTYHGLCYTSRGALAGTGIITISD